MPQGASGAPVSMEPAPAPDERIAGPPNQRKTTITIMEKVPQITIRDGWCKGCTFCVAFCPKHVLSMAGSLPVATDPAQCTRCLLCVYVCPDFAIKVE